MFIIRRIAAIIYAIPLILTGCGGENFPFNPIAPTGRPLSDVPSAQRLDFYASAPDVTIDASRTYTAIIHTRRGDIVIELDAQNAPLHTNNFVFVSEQGFYDGLKFHRVESGFVIQGGDPIGNGAGGPGYNLPAEIGLPHGEGVIAAARLSDAANPERLSSGSQYYITLAPQPALDGLYSVFGRVSAGFDVVQKIKKDDMMVWVEIQVQ